MPDVVTKTEGTQDEIEKKIDLTNGPLEIPPEVKNIYEPDDEPEGEGKDEKEIAAAGAAKTLEKEDEGKSKEEEVTAAEELAELRQIAREQKKQLDRLSGDLTAAQEALKKAELLPQDDPEAAKKAEEYQALRAGNLETILEIMELNPKFEDVREVVSQKHFDDVVDAMAQYIVQEEGGKLSDKVNAVETAIWGMTNPYKYMYDKIKQFHPDYKAAPKAASAKPAGTKESKADEKELPKIPGSIHNIPGGSSGSGGWTSAMIDALEEMELGKVPKDVYDKYLKNELA